MKSDLRIEQLTFTRFIAAIAIVIYHYGEKIFPFDHESVSFLFRRAYIGVGYFFILSGFVMIIAYTDRSKISALEFYKNRFARIYPAYFLAIMLLFIYRFMVRQDMEVSGLVLNILMIQAWIPDKAMSFNYPGWSLSIELFFYLIFPFLLNFIYKKAKLSTVCIAVILIWLASQVVFKWLATSGFLNESTGNYNFLYYFPVMHLNEFLIGNLAGLFFVRSLTDKKGNYDIGILLSVVAVIAFIKLSIGSNSHLGLNFHNGILAFLFVPFILFVSLNKGFLATIFSFPFFIFLGEISYGIYIFQFPVFEWMGGLFRYLHSDHQTIQFYLSVLALILVSSLSYLLIEKPLRTMIKNRKQI